MNFFPVKKKPNIIKHTTSKKQETYVIYIDGPDRRVRPGGGYSTVPKYQLLYMNTIMRVCSVGYYTGAYPGMFGGRTELAEVSGIGMERLPNNLPKCWVPVPKQYRPPDAQPRSRGYPDCRNVIRAIRRKKKTKIQKQ